jgi:pilus assembly protein CpaC
MSAHLQIREVSSHKPLAMALIKALAVLACAAALPALAKPSPASTPGPAAETPAAEPCAPDKAAADATQAVSLATGKSMVLHMGTAVARLSVGNPAVADVILLSSSEIYVVAKGVGSTNIVVWGKNGETKVVDVSVGVDPAGLQAKLMAVLPGESDLQVQVAGDSLVLTGSVSSAVRLDKAVELANAYAGKKVLNFLQVGTPQQVMLEVKVAEINRTMAEKLGFDFQGALTSAGGAWTRTVSGIIGGGASAAFGANHNNTQKIAGFTGTGADVPRAVLQPTATNLGTQDFASFLVNAQKSDGLVKILAEPIIVAISGQEGSFLAGGEIMIPVPQPGGTTIMQSKQFGVELKFLPTVLDNGTVNIRVSSAVSSLVGFSAVANTALGGQVLVPTLTSRHVATTVQLREGQSLAIGGLLQDNYRSNIQRFPILGEIPLLGLLFRSTDYQSNKTELLIVITPRLSRALARQPKLPTDAFVEPSRAGILLGGKLEGTADDAVDQEKDKKDKKDGNDKKAPKEGKTSSKPASAPAL